MYRVPSTVQMTVANNCTIKERRLDHVWGERLPKDPGDR